MQITIRKVENGFTLNYYEPSGAGEAGVPMHYADSTYVYSTVDEALAKVTDLLK